MIKAQKTHSFQRDEAQRVAKQAKVGQRGTERKSEPPAEPSTWLPTLMLDGAPLLDDASIRDFRAGRLAMWPMLWSKLFCSPETGRVIVHEES